MITMKRPRYHRSSSSILSFFVLIVLFSLTINPLISIAATGVDSPGVRAPHKSERSPSNGNQEPADDLAPSVVFSNPALITIVDSPAPSAQSTISVSGLVGSISSITLTLTNLNTPRSGQLQFLVVGPGGQSFVFLSDAGGVATATAGATITFSDAAASGLTQAGAIPSGTFKPTDFDASVAFPAPAPAGPYNHAQPFGSATFTSVYGGLSGASVNGNWNLYAFDDGAGGGNSTVNGGWSLDITVAAAAATTTTLGSSANPSFTNQAITLTSTTTSTSTVNIGVVDFFDNTTSVLLCNDAPVNGSGQATCVVPAGTLSERIHNITATYVGNATFATSNGSINQTVNTPTVISGGGTVFTNPGGITISDSGANPPAVPYPSNIIVSGLSGTISKVTLTLTNFSAPRTNDKNFLLRGPGGQTYVFLSDVGGAVATSGVTITLDDAAASLLPNSGSLATGTFRPTDYAVDPETFPAPAPAGPYPSAAPAGSSTFATVYNGLAPNGTWSLFGLDDAGGGGASTVGSWSLTFITTADAPTTTVVSGSPNPSFTNQAVLFTATVTSTSTVNVGTVTFRRGATILCNAVPVNGSGVATCNVAAGGLPEGDLTITADYNGSPGAFNTSTGNTIQQVNSPTVRTGTNFANNGGITITDATVATPYPSRIFVTGLGGTITKVTVSLNGLTTTAPDHFDLLLVGPGGQKFLFMGDAGGTNAISGVNLVLDDAAASPLPDSTTLTSGTFRPTSYTLDPDVFPAPAPAGPYNPAAPEGAGTFALFNGIVPNGTWSLYAVEDQGNGGNTTLTGWSLTFTLAPAATTTSVTSSADPSVFGQAVTFTATVSTAGLGTPTGNVQFFDGATPIGGPVALNVSGQAQVTTSSLSVGNHTITAQYAGDVPSGFNASSGGLNTNPQTVNQASTTTGLTSNQGNPVGTSIPTTFTATVSPVAPGAGTRTGTVTFSRNGSPICSNVPINASGQATCTITFTIAGNYNITAVYSGDTNFTGSTSTTFVQQVVGPTAANVGISGRVTDAAGRGVPGATVTMQNQDGVIVYAITNPFGYYRFVDVPSGQTYLASVTHKRYTFQPRTITVNDELTDVNFVAEGESRSTDTIMGGRNLRP